MEDTQHSVPKRLYLGVPYSDLSGVLEGGLEPAVLHEAKAIARKRARAGGKKSALLTVHARDAEREGVRFDHVDGGWQPSQRIEPHLLACRDRHALRALGVERKVSAGGLVVSSLEDPRVLLLFRRKGDATAWKTPKGGIKRKESRRQAARREVGEEAGIKRVRILGRLGRMQYFKRREDGGLSEKTVHLYLMLNKEGEGTIAPREGEHFVSCEWLAPDEAIERVTQLQTRGLIARAQRRLKRAADRGASPPGARASASTPKAEAKGEAQP